MRSTGQRTTNPVFTIPFPLLFCEAEDKGRQDPALTIPFLYLFCETEDKGKPDPPLTIPFPVKKLRNKLALNIPYNILKNCPLFSFVPFLIVLVTPFNKILESSRN